MQLFYPGYQKQRHIYLSPRLCALVPVILSIFRPGDCVGRPSRAELQILSSDIQTEYSFFWYLSKARQCLFYLHLVRLLCCTALGALVWPSAMLLVHLMSCRGFYAHVVVIPAQLLQCTLSVQLVQLVKYKWYTWHCCSWCIDIWLVHLM